MIFFENNPKRRLAFAVVYFLCAFRFIIKDFVWSNLIVIIILLFVSYIILVKAKIIKDKNANVIDNYKFDLFNVFFAVFAFLDMVIEHKGTVLLC